MKITKIKSCLLVIDFIFMLIVLFFDISNAIMYHNNQRNHFRPRMNKINLRKTANLIYGYAMENANIFPASLKELEKQNTIKDPQNLIWQDPNAFQYISFLSLIRYRSPRAKYFLYFPPKEKLSEQMDFSRIILAEPYPSNGERQYVTLEEFLKGGNLPKLPDEEFRKRAKEQGLKLPD